MRAVRGAKAPERLIAFYSKLCRVSARHPGPNCRQKCITSLLDPARAIPVKGDCPLPGDPDAFAVAVDGP